MSETPSNNEQDRLSVVGSDNRPQVSQMVDRFNKHLMNFYKNIRIKYMILS